MPVRIDGQKTEPIYTGCSINKSTALISHKAPMTKYNIGDLLNIRVSTP